MLFCYFFCDDTLIELANIRAKEIVNNFSHVGDGVTYTGAGENINGNAATIQKDYEAWYASAGHRENMLLKDYKYFGYAFYRPDGYTGSFGVQLFWTPTAQWDYMYYHANK